MKIFVTDCIKTFNILISSGYKKVSSISEVQAAIDITDFDSHNINLIHFLLMSEPSQPLFEININNFRIFSNCMLGYLYIKGFSIHLKKGMREKLIGPRSKSLFEIEREIWEEAIIFFDLCPVTWTTLAKSVDRSINKNAHLMYCIARRAKMLSYHGITDELITKIRRKMKPLTDTGEYYNADMAKVIQQSINLNRTRSERRFIEIRSNPVNYYKYVYNNDVETVFKSILNSSTGTVFISFHTEAYFLLSHLISLIGIKCTVIANEAIVEKYQNGAFDKEKNLAFATKLSPRLIKECVGGQTCLFIMADVLYPAARCTFLPIQGRAILYSITWAELTARYKLNLAPVFLRDVDGKAEVFCKMYPASDVSEFDLAHQVAFDFSEFWSGKPLRWENYPIFENCAIPCEDEGDKESATLRKLWHLGQSDYEIADMVRKAMISLQDHQ